MNENTHEIQDIKIQILTEKPSNVKDFVELFLRMYENDKYIELDDFISVIKEMNLKVFIANIGYEVDKSGLKTLLERRMTQINLQINFSKYSVFPSQTETHNTQNTNGREEREAKNLAWRVEQLNKKREEEAKALEIKKQELKQELREKKQKINQVIEIIHKIIHWKKQELDDFTNSQEWKYIRHFTKKYGGKGKMEDLVHLQTLLENRQWEFSVEVLKSLVSEEYKKQKVENLKTKLLADNPHNRGAILKVYLNFYRSDDEINLKILVELLKEKYLIKEDIYTLKTDLQTIEKRIELENFEKRLLEEDEQIQLEEIDNLNGYEFEDFLKNLFSKMGYQVEQTRLSGDQGADLVVIKFGEKKVIQAKRYGAKVGNYAVQEIMAAISLYQARKGMVVTNNYFTPAAIELANANNIELIDRDFLEELINKHW